MDDPNALTIYYNRKWAYNQGPQPQGLHPHALKLVEEPLGSVSLAPGQALVKTEFISVDPHSTCQPAFVLYQATGGIPLASAICRVVAVEDPTGEFHPNDVVIGTVGWQLYSVVPVSSLRRPKPLHSVEAVTNHLSAFGPTGKAAYFGLLAEGNPQQGETVVISGAAGGVGHLAVQMARLRRCKVVGIVGNEEKRRYLQDQLQIHRAINRRAVRSPSEIGAELQAACPEGIDLYFDLVGGAVSDAVFPHMKVGGRVVVAGQSSQYHNVDHPEVAARNFHHILFKRLRVVGFQAEEHLARPNATEEFERQMDQWLLDGRIRLREEVVEGFEQLSGALTRTLAGEFIGKVVVKCDYSATAAHASPRGHVHAH